MILYELIGSEVKSIMMGGSSKQRSIKKTSMVTAATTMERTICDHEA